MLLRILQIGRHEHDQTTASWVSGIECRIHMSWSC
jgi:hypothetical protein